MKSFRLTLISDPTDEHPQNQNNNFKVRLPTRLHLDNTWQASLWSVSVPDVGHSSFTSLCHLSVFLQECQTLSNLEQGLVSLKLFL